MHATLEATPALATARPLQDRQTQLLSLSRTEKAQAIQILVQSLSNTWTGIEKIPGICGGDARIANTRIPIWGILQALTLKRRDFARLHRESLGGKVISPRLPVRHPVPAPQYTDRSRQKM
jgi:hypothetical protein